MMRLRLINSRLEREELAHQLINLLHQVRLVLRVLFPGKPRLGRPNSQRAPLFKFPARALSRWAVDVGCLPTLLPALCGGRGSIHALASLLPHSADQMVALPFRQLNSTSLFPDS
jgi:hypothetical protein